jgi:hypothetical protein
MENGRALLEDAQMLFDWDRFGTALALSNFRSSELTSGKLFPLHRPSTMMGMPERCSPARIRFAALTRVLACSAPFRRLSTCDGRLRREHLSDSGSHQWLTRKKLTVPAFSWK